MTTKILTTILLIIICITNSYAQDSPKKLEITHLIDDFYIFTTYQNYKGSPYPANGMYVVTNKGVIMIDTPWDTTQFQPLLDSIWARHKQKVHLCIATHSHEDRSAGLEYYRNQKIQTYTIAKTDSISKARNKKRAEFIMPDDMTFVIGNYVFRAYYAGAGHTPDNIVIWFPKRKLLYGGCLIKSKEASNLGNLEDADVTAWRKTLVNIQNTFPEPHYIIPGHQGWKSRKSLTHTLKMVNEYLESHPTN